MEHKMTGNPKTEMQVNSADLAARLQTGQTICLALLCRHLASELKLNLPALIADLDANVEALRLLNQDPAYVLPVATLAEMLKQKRGQPTLQ